VDGAGQNTMTLAGTSWAAGPLPNVGAVTGFNVGRLDTAGGGPNLGTGDFTALSLIRATGGLDGSARGIFGNYVDDSHNGWSVKLQGGLGTFMLLTNDTSHPYCQAQGGNVTPNTWHLVGGRRQAGVTNSLLEDGASVLALCKGDTRNVSGPGPFEIGRQYNGTVPFVGAISVSLLYNRAMPDAEFATLDALLRNPNPPGVNVVGAPPGAPTIGVATPGGTSASVTFTPPAAGGAPITSYQVTCTPFGSGTGLQSPVVANGLVAGEPHRCAVRALNMYGAGPWSADTSAFIPGGAPSISSPNIATFVVTQPGTFTIATSGAPAPLVTLSGSLPSGLTLTNGVIQGTPASGTAGTYALSVTAANGVVPAATQVLNLEVVKETQTIAVPPIDNQIFGPVTINVRASATSGLDVTVASTTPDVCTLNMGTQPTVTLVAVGVCTLKASQSGNADFAAAQDVELSFEVAQPPPPATDASAPATDSASPDDATSPAPPVTSSLPADNPAPTTPGTPKPPPIETAPQSSAAPNLGIEGGGCACDAAGSPSSMSGLFAAMVGAFIHVLRRRRRSGRTRRC
jgi:hypothetical protein